MKTLKRILAGLLTATAAIRLAGARVWQGPAGVASVGLGAVRLALVFGDIAKGELPWQRALLPSALLLQWSWMALRGGGERRGLHFLLAALEIVAVALLIGIWRTPATDGTLPEQRLARSLRLFLPELPARWAAVEMVVLGSALRWPFQRVPEGPGIFGYSRHSSLFYLPLVLAIEIPAEYLIVRHAFGLESFFWHAVLLGVSVWGLIWFTGLLSTMRMRPHVIDGNILRLHKGILASAEILLADLEAVAACDDAHEPVRAARLTLPGVDTVELRLRRPVQIDRLFGRPVQADRLWVSAEEPAQFARALTVIR